MSTNVKIDRTKTCFVTDEGIISFPKVFAGQAQPPEDGGASRTYSLEHVAATISQQLADAVAYVAQLNDQQWQRHVFGPLGKFKKLEEMPGRKASDYPYAAGKFLYRIASTLYPDGLEMKGANLADPAIRAQYEAKVAQAAPRVVRYANPQLPADIEKIQKLNQERMFKGLQPYAESEYGRIQLPVEPLEMWPGCIVRVAGQAYWNKRKSTVSLGLDMILLVREGERLVVTANPDTVFGAFAPSAELAPAPAAKDPWAAYR